ncbi:SIR2 family protein [Pinirhizobacter soli]|uniref:SIR2 family protein n=1 Tax=Pinirhizobacter soli TaxID=2786953 RepID=UPI00202AA612|nr:SIR2 family protein [Pinirhizobacter soli]
MAEDHHDPLQTITQLRQTLSADKLSIGFFLGAGCPCAVSVPNEDGSGERAIIPDIRGLTKQVHASMATLAALNTSYEALTKTFAEDAITDPTIEAKLNRIRAFREVAGKAGVRGLSFDQLNELDREICQSIRKIVTCSLPAKPTPYHALARFIAGHRSPFTEIFTTNYDVLVEQALEEKRVPYFDGFVGSSRPFFDQRAIEDAEIPKRWSRLWKLHGSINWRYNKETKAVFRSDRIDDGDELLIHPSHLKYDESRRMPYFVMIDRLRSFLRHSERPVALILTGYSFGDEHINEAIVESLKANASAACFALQFGKLADYQAAAALAKDNANLSLLALDGAVIRRHAGVWMANPSTDVSTLKSAFEIVEEADASTVTADVSAPEVARRCRMTLGDFKRLGEFLDEFSGFGVLGGSTVSP